MDLIVAALATWQIIEIWHHSLLLAPLRSKAEMLDNKLGELLVCPFCLSVWVAFICIATLQYASSRLVGEILCLLVYAFAVSRLANLGNDFFKSYCLTPRISFNDYAGGDENTE